MNTSNSHEYSDSGEIPDDLILALKEGRCVLFAGAGVSMDAGLPSWETLLQKMIKRIADFGVTQEERAVLSKLLKDGHFLDVAEACKEYFVQHDKSEEEFADFLESQLVGIGQPTDLHQVIAELPIRCLVTTNFDTLLEDKIAGQKSVVTFADRSRFGHVLNEITSSYDKKRFIIKPHGCITNIYKEGVIFTRSDYRKLMHDNAPFRHFFSHLLSAQVVLFVGYSNRDPDFRLLFDEHLTHFGGVGQRYALMKEDPTLSILHKDYFKKIISYKDDDDDHKSDDHKSVLHLLQNLRDKLKQEKQAESRLSRLYTIAPVALDFERLVNLDTTKPCLIVHSHKGKEDHKFGNFDDYQIAGIPFDEVEIVMSIWNLASLLIGADVSTGGRPKVRPVCCCAGSGQNEGKKAFEMEIQNDSTCLIGSPSSNRLTRRVMKNLRKRTKDGKLTSKSDQITSNQIPLMTEAGILAMHGSGDPKPYESSKTKFKGLNEGDRKGGLEDYALMLRIPDILSRSGDNGQSIIVLAGCKAAGQVAIGRWFTRPDTLRKLVEEYELQSFFVVLHVKYTFVAERMPQLDGPPSEIASGVLDFIS